MGAISERRDEILELSRNRQNTNNIQYPTTGNYGAGAFGTILKGASIFLAKDKDGAGGKDGKISDKTQKEIDAKQKEIDQIFSEQQVANLSALNRKCTENQTAITALGNECTKINNDISLLRLDIEGAEKQYNKYYNEDGTQKDPNTQIPSNIPTQAEIKTMKENLASLETKLIEKEKELNTKQANQAILETAKGNVENLQDEILQLKGEELSEEIKYDVTKESSDIKTFMTALKAFKANPNKETAKALKDAHEKGDIQNGQGGVQQASVQKAYELVESQVNALLVA